jgi:hypothetical protein
MMKYSQFDEDRFVDPSAMRLWVAGKVTELGPKADVISTGIVFRSSWAKGLHGANCIMAHWARECDEYDPFAEIDIEMVFIWPKLGFYDRAKVLSNELASVKLSAIDHAWIKALVTWFDLPFFEPLPPRTWLEVYNYLSNGIIVGDPQ